MRMKTLKSHKLSCGCEVETYMHGHNKEQTVKHCPFHSSSRALYNALKLFEKNELLSEVVDGLDPKASEQIFDALREAEKGLSDVEIKSLFWNGSKD